MMAIYQRPAPPCFKDQKSYDEWRYLSVRAGSKGNYCIDCTPIYKTKMMLAGKCSWPLTTFVQVRGGDVIGIRKYKGEQA